MGRGREEPGRSAERGFERKVRFRHVPRPAPAKPAGDPWAGFKDGTFKRPNPPHSEHSKHSRHSSAGAAGLGGLGHDRPRGWYEEQAARAGANLKIDPPVRQSKLAWLGLVLGVSFAAAACYRVVQINEQRSTLADQTRRNSEKKI
jgi:hypothetical protein